MDSWADCLELAFDLWVCLGTEFEDLRFMNRQLTMAEELTVTGFGRVSKALRMDQLIVLCS